MQLRALSKFLPSKHNLGRSVGGCVHHTNIAPAPTLLLHLPFRRPNNDARKVAGQQMTLSKH